MRDVFVGFSLLQYGSVMAWDRRIPNAEGALMPAGEGEPPLDYWLQKLRDCGDLAGALAILETMRAELAAWRRRPDPPPRGESMSELKRRVLSDGEGWTPQEVALAMRVTPTFVRNVRTEAERDPQYGGPDGSLAHGLALLSDGLSLRQVAQITGIPKSTLHDAYRASCLPFPIGGSTLSGAALSPCPGEGVDPASDAVAQVTR